MYGIFLFVAKQGPNYQDQSTIQSSDMHLAKIKNDVTEVMTKITLFLFQGQYKIAGGSELYYTINKL